jgi:hypothetical protein
MSEEAVTFNLEINVEPALNGIRQIEGLTFRTLGYTDRILNAAGAKDIAGAVRIFQEITMVVRLAHSAIIAFEMASGPIGWWRAILGLVGAGFMVESIGAQVTPMVNAYYNNQRGMS